jgi:very-short-patch-repair endonuclease
MHAFRPNRYARSTLFAERAHSMRQSPTDSEQLLWARVLRCQGMGVEFRRQVVIGDTFIVDFVAPRQRLVVEVDGRAYHQRRRAADARRDRKLARLGYRVLRLDADLVTHDLSEAVARIAAALAEPP